MKHIMLFLILMLALSLNAQVLGWEFYHYPLDKAPLAISSQYLYFGGNPGLGRYDLQSGITDYFYAYNSGLPRGNIYSLHCEANGTLYIGGFNSLSRYDGSTWYVFNLAAMQVNIGSINAIIKNPDGSFWLGGTSGLLKTDLITYELFNSSNTPFPALQVKDMELDNTGRLWVSSSGPSGQVGYWDDGVWTMITPNIYGETGGLSCDQNNNVWCGKMSGLYCSNGTGWTQIYNPQEPSSWNNFSSVAVDADNTIWAITNGRVFKFSNDVWTYFYHVPYNELIPLKKLVPDGNGGVFFCSSKLYHNTERVSGVDDFDNYYPFSTYRKDRLGRNWFGMLGGFTVYDGETWQDFDHDSYYLLNGETFKDIAFDNANTLYAALNNRIINFDGTSWSYFQLPPIFPTISSLNCLEFDAQDNLWIGTNDGLLKKNGNNWQVYNTTNSALPSNLIRDMAIDSVNRLVFSTDNGIARYDPLSVSWEVFNSDNAPFVSNYFSSLFVCSDDQLWARSGDYVYYYDNVSWTPHQLPLMDAGYVDNAELGVDNQGRLWVNMYMDGIARLEGDSWTILNYFNSPLQYNVVQALASDSSGKIWIGIRGGMQSYQEPVAIVDAELIPIPRLQITAYPNPFNPETSISFQLEKAENIRLEIFNLKGQKLITLADQALARGEHRYIFKGVDSAGNALSSGIYIVKLSTRTAESSTKITLMK